MAFRHTFQLAQEKVIQSLANLVLNDGMLSNRLFCSRFIAHQRGAQAIRIGAAPIVRRESECYSTQLLEKFILLA